MNVESILKFFEKYDLTVSDVVKAVQFLKHYGYLIKDDKFTIEDLIEALTKLQQFYHMKVDGELGPSILRAMDAPRCALPDFNMEAASNLSKWNKKSLTYYIKNYVNDLDKDDQEEIFDKAFQQWEEVCDINISRSNSSGADLIIDVGSGRRDNFDGPSGTLAWAYLPNGNDGQLLMKFDLSETWTLTTAQRGILLLNVACHEFGHMLGLGHSNVRSALMQPTYAPGITKPQENDDIPRMIARYGKRTTPLPTPTPTPTPGDDTTIITVFGNITDIYIPGYTITKKV